MSALKKAMAEARPHLHRLHFPSEPKSYGLRLARVLKPGDTAGVERTGQEPLIGTITGVVYNGTERVYDVFVDEA